MRLTLPLAALTLAAAPALAQETTGDAAAGKAAFMQCAACHQVITPGGEKLAGMAPVGPNLYGVAGSTAGKVEGYAYSDGLVALGEAGIEWTEENFVEYVANPAAYIKENTDVSAPSKMTFMLQDAATAKDIYAYLASLAE